MESLFNPDLISINFISFSKCKINRNPSVPGKMSFGFLYTQHELVTGFPERIEKRDLILVFISFR